MQGIVLLQQESWKFLFPSEYAIPYNNFLKRWEGNNLDIGIIYSKDEYSSRFMPYLRDIRDLKNVIFAFITVKRNDFILPSSIQLIEINDKTFIGKRISQDFLKYIISLDYQLYSAISDDNAVLKSSIENWFTNFQNALRQIYKCSELKLKRDAKNLTFNIEIPGREPFALHQMADGYAAFLDIYMELIMRFESEHGVVDYNHPAIVLIDEIEAHLHVELQKEILPFLTGMFPNVQFIVSTHSPFVISSLKNAVVFDLEKKECLENPGSYSYEAIVEGYLDVGQYSNEMRSTFKRYRELYNKELTAKESEEFDTLISELENVPPASKELFFAFRTMEDNRKR
jgi:hypothetical protein